MAKLSNEEKRVIQGVASAIPKELLRHEIKLFAAKPTAYVTVGDERLYVSLADEGEQKTEVCLSQEKKVRFRQFGFFVNRFILTDFLGNDASLIENFANAKVKDYLEETREANAYSKNLQRADSLTTNGYHYAAQIMLVSAFEVACRDIFFRNNSYWFVRISPHELYRKFGAGLLAIGEDRAKWEAILLNDQILRICRQLGIIEEYYQKLYGNSFQEIGYYEILKYVLQNSGRRPIDFQMLEGTGGMKWSFKHFFDIDLDKVSTEMKVLKECFQKRHQIIHGELDDKAVTKNDVLELQNAVRGVISYLRDEVMSWEWIQD